MRWRKALGARQSRALATSLLRRPELKCVPVSSRLLHETTTAGLADLSAALPSPARAVVLVRVKAALSALVQLSSELDGAARARAAESDSRRCLLTEPSAASSGVRRGYSIAAAASNRSGALARPLLVVVRREVARIE